MSRIFYDHLLNIEDFEKEIKEITQTSEEKEELWLLIDGIIHHKVLGCILDDLPHEHHEEFILKIQKTPHDDCILEFIKEKIEKDIEEKVRNELQNFKKELLEEINE